MVGKQKKKRVKILDHLQILTLTKPIIKISLKIWLEKQKKVCRLSKFHHSIWQAGNKKRREKTSQITIVVQI